MIDLHKLADRCEKASAPDRELDRDIMTALSLAPDYAGDWGPRDNCRPAPFAYTASIDAALTLAGDGADIGVLIFTALLDCINAGADIRRDLARFIVAAALRAIAKEKGND